MTTIGWERRSVTRGVDQCTFIFILTSWFPFAIIDLSACCSQTSQVCWRNIKTRSTVLCHMRTHTHSIWQPHYSITSQHSVQHNRIVIFLSSSHIFLFTLSTMFYPISTELMSSIQQFNFLYFTLHVNTSWVYLKSINLEFPDNLLKPYVLF